ncbi:MAG: NAD(+)/NADH kinase [Roseburia sp.]|nr:NAD(+)/NADH kinase [Roseburia sp.]MCM1243197.1 NAD(+)/NADH kinase [Roseburia sp.]
MKHFLLITNQLKDPDGIYTDKIAAYLENCGARAVCVTGQQMPQAETLQGIECAIVLGGDGTVLKAARGMARQGIPLIGVNLGTLGYLTEVEMSNIEEALDKLLTGDYIREERMMLAGNVHTKESGEVNGFALNDIVLSRCGSLQILQFDIYVNGRFLNAYSADGMIVATPTGSTGYNMSAGGPIVEPGAALLLLTPICPHTLNTRSIVLSPEDEVGIVIPEGRDHTVQTLEANFDGTQKIVLRTGDKIVIRRASETTGILKLNTESFLEVLHKKMAGDQG